jgi:hypothetical protein
MTLKSRKKNEGKTDLLPRHCFLEIPKYIIFGKGMEKDKKKKKSKVFHLIKAVRTKEEFP